MNINEQSNIADIAARHNELSGKGADPKSLAKRGKVKLLEQIKSMEDAKAVEALGNLGASVEKIEEAKEQPNGLTHLLKRMQDAQAAAKAKGHNAGKASAEVRRGEKPKKEKKVKGPVIRVVAEALLLEVTHKDEDGRPYGHAYDTILERIREQFEGAKTTVACLRWYAVHMRERGEKVPNRPRAQPAKAAKED